MARYVDTFRLMLDAKTKKKKYHTQLICLHVQFLKGKKKYHAFAFRIWGDLMPLLPLTCRNFMFIIGPPQ